MSFDDLCVSSTTYQHPEFGQSTGFDYTVRKLNTRNSWESLAAIESADYVGRQALEMSAIVLA